MKRTWPSLCGSLLLVAAAAVAQFYTAGDGLVYTAASGTMVVGWITFRNAPASAVGGTLYCFRPAGNTPTVYQSGFTSLMVPSGQVTLSGGNLPFAITNQIILEPNGTITVPPPNTDKLALTVNKTPGAISGSFANPSNPKLTVKVSGVLLQNQTNAAGYFLGTSQSGPFLLENRLAPA